jgi:excisionase family DNA binding protein
MPTPDDDFSDDARLSSELYDLVEGLKEEVRALREELTTEREKALLTRDEAADRLRISTRTLDTLEAEGKLQAVRVRGRVLYHPDALDAFIRKASQ